MMSLTTAISRVCSRLNKNASDNVVKARIKNHINDTCLEKWNGYAWSFRFRDYPLVLNPLYTTGTATCTNASQTVTGSGTTWVSATHAGAWIQFTSDTTTAIYRVVAVNSSTSLTIEPAYQGTTGSGKAYRLCPTDYVLPTEVTDLSHLSVSYNGYPLMIEHQSMTDNFRTPILSQGYPTTVNVFNQKLTQTTYTTGTVTGTINTQTLTGTSTAWLANVQPGDEIVISGDTNTYRVYSVSSDTSLTLYNNLVAAPSGATYTISRQFGKVLRITPTSDTSYVCFIKGLRAYTYLVNDADTNEMLIRYPHAVVEGAIWRELGASPDPREDSNYMRSERMWIQAQGEDEQIFANLNQSPIYDSRQRGR